MINKKLLRIITIIVAVLTALSMVGFLLLPLVY